MLGSSRAQACYVVAWSLPRRSGSLEEIGCRLFWFPVFDDLPVLFSSPPARTSAMRVWLVLLEDPLELGKMLAIFIEFRFELSYLRKLRGFVFRRRGVDLTVVPRRPGVLPCYRGSTAGDDILRFVSGFYFPVDVEAFPSRVVAVGFRVGIRHCGVETSASFFCQPLPE